MRPRAAHGTSSAERDRPAFPARAGALATLLGLTAAVDVTRCGIGLALDGVTIRLALLLITGAVAAIASLIAAAGAVRRRTWALWSAALIGIASAPQAAVTGFRPPYVIPDVATAALGFLLTVSVLVGTQRVGADVSSDALPCLIDPKSHGRS
jgi:lysylphosphatidylglycerol synthetase-like protein (DUF2156 family)